ncbi:MAG: LytTR family transcriptional regulator DNA-binding domain-containing protein [Steroidobacteraceae bacterium]|nr:LytTR family transcriptional regulator DNA-binding domain-containing protein [Steroidobacteraceae bacterium]
MIRTLIVDDEALARRGLELRLRDAADFEIVGEAVNGREAIEAIVRLKPDLVFLDIQMPGLGGFDVLRQLPADSMPMAVFVTAYDKYALEAFEAQALDYLLKPVDDARLAKVLDRVREQHRQRNAAQTALPAYADVLPIRTGRETVRVRVQAIDWIDAAGDYMCVHAEGQTHVVRGTMKQFDAALDPRQFQRVHRSAIVNVDRVRSLRPHTNGEYFLTLEGGHELKLSRSYRDRLEALLGQRRR